MKSHKAELIASPNPLGEGEDPPSGLINPEYKKQPRNPRKCIECGKWHDTIVENTVSGERLEEIEKCKGCLFKNFINPAFICPSNISSKSSN